MKRIIAALASAGVIGFGGIAAAEPNIDKAIDAAIACRSIGADADRLACLDAAATSLEAARSGVALRKAEKKQKKKADELAQFGLRGADREIEEEADVEEALEASTTETADEFGAEGIFQARHARLDKKLSEIAATSTKITLNSRRQATLYLDNGQIWRQLSADNRMLTATDKSDPYPVVIKRSAFGNYTATVVGIDRTIRVSRIK